MSVAILFSFVFWFEFVHEFLACSRPQLLLLVVTYPLPIGMTGEEEESYFRRRKKQEQAAAARFSPNNSAKNQGAIVFVAKLIQFN